MTNQNHVSQMQKDGWSFIPYDMLPPSWPKLFEYTAPCKEYPHGMMRWHRVKIYDKINMFISHRLRHCAGRWPKMNRNRYSICWHPSKADRMYLVDYWVIDPVNQQQFVEYMTNVKWHYEVNSKKSK